MNINRQIDKQTNNWPKDKLNWCSKSKTYILTFWTFILKIYKRLHLDSVSQ